MEKKLETAKEGKEVIPGKLAVKVIAMPADTNADGDIFGGWILSNMDAAAALIARDRAKTRVATVAINNMTFHRPASVGDCIECWGEVVKVGTTSVTVRIETWVERRKPACVKKSRQASLYL